MMSSATASVKNTKNFSLVEFNITELDNFIIHPRSDNNDNPDILKKYYTKILTAFRQNKSIFTETQASISQRFCDDLTFKNGKLLFDFYMAYDVPVVSPKKLGTNDDELRIISEKEILLLDAAFKTMEKEITTHAPIKKIYKLIEFVKCALIKYTRETADCVWIMPYFQKLVHLATAHYDVDDNDNDNRAQYFVELFAVVACTSTHLCRTDLSFLNFFKDVVLPDLFDLAKDTSQRSNSAQLAVLYILGTIPLDSYILDDVLNLEHVPTTTTTGNGVWDESYLTYRVFRALALRITTQSLVVNPSNLGHQVEHKQVMRMGKSVLPIYKREPCEGVRAIYRELFDGIALG